MSQQNLDEKIAERAYLIWEQEGQPMGKEEEHWFRAAQELQGSCPLSDSVVVSRVDETAVAIDNIDPSSGASEASKKAPKAASGAKAASKGKTRKG